MAQEVECWTVHLVGGVATTTRVEGSNLEEADVSNLNQKLICGDVCSNFHQNTRGRYILFSMKFDLSCEIPVPMMFIEYFI